MNQSNSALRIGLSTTMIEPALTHGRVDGIGVYTRALLAGLPAHGCQVQSWSYVPLSKPALAQQMQVGQPLSSSFEWASIRDLLLPSSRSRMNADVFHVTDYRVVRMQCPVVATLHDAVPIKYPHWCNSRARGLKNWLQKKAAKKADHVIALSHYAVAELVECFGVDERRITVVPCGVDAAWRVSPTAEQLAQTLQRHQLRAGYFLFVGTFQPRKNVERILQAYLQLPTALKRERSLVLVGRAGWQCDALLQQIRAAQQAGEAVHWLNQVAGQDELRALYAGAGVFVFPSLYEGFGIPVAEAFAAGVAVVTANTTSLPEVSQGAALEVNPEQVAEIADAMRQLAQDDALRARCVQAGLVRSQALSWDVTAEQTAAVYRAVLQRG